MQAWLIRSQPWRLLSSSARPKDINTEVERVYAVLADALEATRFISASAQQAYLESDPSARGQPESYTARYKTFACSQVEDAIAEYDKLSTDLGEEKMQEIRSNSLDFGLAVADTLLARDQLKKSIREDQNKLERKELHGLRKDDLIFCDGPT